MTKLRHRCPFGRAVGHSVSTLTFSPAFKNTHGRIPLLPSLHNISPAGVAGLAQLVLEATHDVASLPRIDAALHGDCLKVP